MGMAQSSRRPSTRGLTRSLKVNLPTPWDVKTAYLDLRWCSDGFEITCWNGDLIRLAFIIDAHDREIIAWHAVANAGISGSMVRDMMLDRAVGRLHSRNFNIPKD